MPPILALAFYAAPLALLLAAWLASSDRGPGALRALLLSRAASMGALGLAALAALAVTVMGSATSPLLGTAGLGFAIRLDPLSVTLFALVAFIGVLVIQFSRNYLAGNPRQGVFLGDLCLALACVLLLVLSGNLVQLAAAWIGTSLALHRLLVFLPDRPRAQRAAAKKFATARIGDLCMLGAGALLYVQFATGDIASILESAKALEGVTVTLGLAAVLLAVAALLKSAQFPAHGWLPEVMETPTPVSALLHAGIINAGGFLAIRFADVLLAFQPSLHLLALVGGFTALFGGLVMLTQPSVKVSLAWSTVSQMGFMLLQCGLGLFTLAVLHIVAHSLYKAHAFLSSGSALESLRGAAKAPGAGPRPAWTLMGVTLALALYGVIGWALGVLPEASGAATALGAILVMGLSLLFAQGFGSGAPAAFIARSLAVGGGVTLAYFTLHAGAAWLYGASLPATPPAGAAAGFVIALAVTSFALVTLLQILHPSESASPLWRGLRLHLSRGLYANALFDRWIAARGALSGLNR